VHGIELRSGATGGTDIRPATGLRSVPIALSGYLGPSGFGLGAAKLIGSGTPRWSCTWC
jgi:hypothetical protein